MYQSSDRGPFNQASSLPRPKLAAHASTTDAAETAAGGANDSFLTEECRLTVDDEREVTTEVGLSTCR